MIEIELKAKATPELTERLLAVAFWGRPILETTKFDVDDYLDTRDFEFFKRGVFLRVRNDKSVDLKFDAAGKNPHGDCNEASFPFPLTDENDAKFSELCAGLLPSWEKSERLKNAMSSQRLLPFVRIEKTRTTFKLDRATLCLDNVRGLGNFAEIEFLCETEQAAEDARLRLAQLSFDFGVEPVGEGYVELWLKSSQSCALRAR